MKAFKWTAIVMGVLIGGYVVSGVALVFWPKGDPFANHPVTHQQWRTREEAKGVSFTMDAPFRERTFVMRDGVELFARHYGDDADTAIVFLHGIAAESALLNRAAGLLHAATGAEVITPDLRGHGSSGGKRFDVNYIGQYEDDLEDIVRVIRETKPDKCIIIAGHSMGGGIALRYALKENAPSPGGYLLLAPNLGAGPTQRAGENVDSAMSGAATSSISFDSGRLIGLIMFNILGIHAFDHTPIMYFNYPPEMPTYSYAAIASAQPNKPQDSAVALRMIDAPLLVIVGENDEPFVAENFEPLVSANSDGETVFMPDLTHNGLVNSAGTFEVIATWFSAID